MSAPVISGTCHFEGRQWPRAAWELVGWERQANSSLPERNTTSAPQVVSLSQTRSESSQDLKYGLQRHRSWSHSERQVRFLLCPSSRRIRARPSPTCGRACPRPGGSFDLDGKSAELVELKERASAPDLWVDPDAGRAVTRRLAQVEATLSRVGRLTSGLDDAEVLLDLADEADDMATRSEVDAELATIEKDLAGLERESLFYDEYDDHPAIVTVHAGAGGVDAQDWAEILARMYQRYLSDAGFNVTIEGITEGDEAGVKSVTMTVRGDHAYGTLEGGAGSPSPCSNQSFRFECQTADLFCRRRRSPGAVGCRSARDQSRRPAHRHLPVAGRRRAACQQDRLGGSPHPPPKRPGRGGSERTEPAAEQGTGHGDSDRKSVV